jgi:cytoskeleton protein RodZ
VFGGDVSPSEDAGQVSSRTTEQAQEGGTLGQQLRRARESRGVSLREISEQTRITMRHLEAIEADDYKHLPGGIFNRSFIKAYARYVGFDEARALDLYSQEARERGEQAEESALHTQRSRVYTGDPARSPVTTAALSLIILGLFVLIVYAGLHYYRRTSDEPGAEVQATPTPEASAAPAAQNPPPTPALAERLSVTIKANQEVWMRVQVDGDAASESIWQAGQTQEFNPQERLTLNYARSLAGALEITANGTRLNVPTDTKPGIQQELVINKDNFRQYAQQ